MEGSKKKLPGNMPKSIDYQENLKKSLIDVNELNLHTKWIIESLTEMNRNNLITQEYSNPELDAHKMELYNKCLEGRPLKEDTKGLSMTKISVRNQDSKGELRDQDSDEVFRSFAESLKKDIESFQPSASELLTEEEVKNIVKDLPLRPDYKHTRLTINLKQAYPKNHYFQIIAEMLQIALENDYAPMVSIICRYNPPQEVVKLLTPKIVPYFQHLKTQEQLGIYSKDKFADMLDVLVNYKYDVKLIYETGINEGLNSPKVRKDFLEIWEEQFSSLTDLATGKKTAEDFY
jgi:hypothetical protein